MEFAAQVEAQTVASMKEGITYGDMPEEFKGERIEECHCN